MPSKQSRLSKVNLSDEQIEQRLDLLENLMHTANSKDLPYLNQVFQTLIEEQVRRDMNREREGEGKPEKQA